MQGLPGVLAVAAAPAGWIIGGTAALVLRVTSKPWWTGLSITLAGAAWTLGVGGLGAVWGSYTGAYGQVVRAITNQQTPDAGVVAGWVAAMGPLSLVVAGLVAAGLRLYAKLRTPSYRPTQEPPNPRKATKTAAAIATGQVDPADGVARATGSTAAP